MSISHTHIRLRNQTCRMLKTVNFSEQVMSTDKYPSQIETIVYNYGLVEYLPLVFEDWCG